MSILRSYQKEIHALAVEKGWWETQRAIPELLCLIHSEVSEALEAYRMVPGLPKDNLGFREELADTVIRILDLCEAYDIDLEEEILKKHQKNKFRPYRHGGKVC